MKILAKNFLTFCCAALLGVMGNSSSFAQQKDQVIYRGAEQTSYAGPAEYFTGQARVDPLFPSNEIANYVGAYVTFSPGSRSNWHTHTAGQHLIVTKGICWTQTWEGEKSIALVGDAIWCPPDVKHWHGASPDGEMTHLSLAHMKDGQNTVWLEPVTDEQYYSE